MFEMTSKRCLITGAGQGIGAGIARAFAAQGGEVIVTDKDFAKAETIAAEIGGIARRLDVSLEADWLDLESEIPEMDVVVNNAGITGFEESTAAQDPEHAALSDWRHVHRTNLDGTFLGCRYAIRAMRRAGAGSIINISSRSGLVGIPGAAAYAASKAAIRNHTKTVALYCAEQQLNIRCNSVHPAAILTPMWEPMLGNGPEREARMQSFVADTPLRRFGSVEEVAQVCVMLASDAGAYMTGSEINIDGGLLAGSAAVPDRAE